MLVLLAVIENELRDLEELFDKRKLGTMKRKGGEMTGLAGEDRK